MSSELENLQKLAGEVHSLRGQYLNCCQEEDLARRNVTAIVNNLNDAQKKFDEALAIFKGQAPHGTDWQSSIKLNGGIEPRDRQSMPR